MFLNLSQGKKYKQYINSWNR